MASSTGMLTKKARTMSTDTNSANRDGQNPAESSPLLSLASTPVSGMVVFDGSEDGIYVAPSIETAISDIPFTFSQTYPNELGIGFDAGGLWSFHDHLAEDPGSNDVSLTIRAAEGYTFDLYSVDIMGEPPQGSESWNVKITFKRLDGSTETFDYQLDQVHSFVTVSNFGILLDDVVEVTLSADHYVVFNNFDIRDVKTADSAPAAPSVPDLKAASDTGSSSSDNITNDNTPTFSGSGAEAGAIIRLYANDALVGSIAVDASGNWSVTSLPLAQGTYTFTARIEKDGILGPASPGLAVTIDTIAPAAPSVPDLAAASDTGSNDSDNITGDTTPTFNGTAEAWATVRLYANGTPIGETTADGAGNWSTASIPLVHGTYTITARTEDAAGNVGPDSAGTVITVADVDTPPTLGESQIYLPVADEDTPTTPQNASYFAAMAGASDAVGTTSFGIAVTGVTGRGTWEYSTDGINWTSFGSVSSTSALLLGADTQVRYVPDGILGEEVEIIFRAWDQSSGTASTNGVRSTVDVGATDSVSSTEAKGIVQVTDVNDLPTVSAPDSIYAPEDASTPLTGISFADIDAGTDLVTVEFSAPFGTLGATPGSGVLVAQYGPGTVILEGTVGDINAFIAAGGVVFTPDPQETGPQTVTVSINDLGGFGGVPTPIYKGIQLTVTPPDNTAPSVVSVSVPANGTYRSGDALEFVVNFDEAVAVEGTPQLALVIGSQTVYAEYVSGSGTALTFRYTIQAGQLDLDGIAIQSLNTNGGSIKDAAGNAASLTLSGVVGSTAGVLVEATLPSVESIVRNDPEITNADTVTFTVTFSEDVIGVDAGDFTITSSGTATGTVTGISGSGSTYVVTVTGVSGDGTLRLDLLGSGTGITDAYGNAVAGGYTGGAQYLIDNTAPVAVATEIQLSNDQGPSSADLITNVANQTVSGSLSFDLEPGASVLVSLDGGETWAIASVEGLRSWSIDGTLAQGKGTIKVKVVDGAGNEGPVAEVEYELDVTAPTVIIPASTPEVQPDGGIVIRFDGPVFAGPGGVLVLSTSDGGAFATITVDSELIAGWGTDTITINPLLPLPQGKQVSVTWESEFFRDAAGNYVADNASAPYLIEVTGPTNDGPILVSEDGSVSADAANGVLANDVGPEGETLAVIGIEASEGGAGAIGVPLAGEWGTLTIHADGSYSYVADRADRLAAGHHGSDVFIYSVTDGKGGTRTATITFTVEGLNDAAVIEGQVTGSVTEDGALLTGGILTVSDPDVGEGAFQAMANVVGAYGTFSFDHLTGEWTYTLDNENPAVQELDAGETRQETFTVRSIDGTERTITVTVNGSYDPEIVDGTPVSRFLTDNGDGTSTQRVIVTTVSPTRVDEVGDPERADIPVVTDGSGHVLMTVQVPAGVALDFTGPSATKTAVAATADVLGQIGGRSPMGSPERDHLQNGAVDFLGSLPASREVLVQTLTVGHFDAGSLPVVVTGTGSSASGPATVLVIDAMNPTGIPIIRIEGVAFAIVFGRAEVYGGSGADIVYGDSSYQLFDMGDGNNAVYAGGGDDTILGGSGNDWIDGGTGADYMNGGLGNDTYIVDSIGDVIVDAGGTDTVYSMIDYTLATGLENLYLTGDAFRGWGNEAANSIYASANGSDIKGFGGNDRLYGGSSADTIDGGDGDDRIEGGGGNDVLSGGNGIDDIKGGDGNDLIRGDAGNDTLRGEAGNDTVDGGLGNDIIHGGAGNDVLTGGDGYDTFVFDAALGANNVDTITDFNPVHDTIRLDRKVFTAFTKAGVLTSGQFVVGTKALDADDRIIYDKTAGALYYDADGSGVGQAVKFANIGQNLALTYVDFQIV